MNSWLSAFLFSVAVIAGCLGILALIALGVAWNGPATVGIAILVLVAVGTVAFHDVER